jgi:hypothetical protein
MRSERKEEREGGREEEAHLRCTQLPLSLPFSTSPSHTEVTVAPLCKSPSTVNFAFSLCQAFYILKKMLNVNC